MAKFEKFGTENSILTKASTGKVYCDWKNAENLRRCMSPNGKILGRKRTGFTAKEQRMVAASIKRARYMGLLPYTSATL